MRSDAGTGARRARGDALSMETTAPVVIHRPPTPVLPDGRHLRHTVVDRWRVEPPGWLKCP
jgi:hypothetical protein